MKVLKWVAITGGLLLAALVLFGLFASRDYALARTIVIDAPPEKVHELIGDLTRWPEWAPWEEDDPSIETTLGDKSVGVGASQTWTSDSGDGRLEITASDAAAGIEYTMAFVEGETEMPADCKMSYNVKDGKTELVWEMEGSIDVAFLGPLMAVGMDSMVGPMFDDGLEKLKALAEGTATPADE